jgi:hypothetical protein
MGWIGGGLAVIALITALIVVSSDRHAIQAENAGTTGSSTAAAVTTVTGSATTAGGASAPSPSSGNGSSNVPTLPGPSITIDLITPISNNTWTIGQPNPIAWDHPAGVTGEIELVNAVTKAFVGVILSQTGPNQTSYSWDARSIYLSRYGANELDVVPGTYSIRIHFDGNGLGDLVSGPITITN